MNTLSLTVTVQTPLQSSAMAFSSWFSRLRSSSKPFYGNLRHSLLNRNSSPSPQIREALISDKKRKPLFSWASSLLLPLALAVSAGSLSLHTHDNPSLCDASHVDPRYSIRLLFFWFLITWCGGQLKRTRLIRDQSHHPHVGSQLSALYYSRDQSHRPHAGSN